MKADLSVIIPIFNRGELIRYTLESVRRASAGFAVETIIVDDGSTPPVAESFARLGFTPTRLIRQENQGLLLARLAGFAAATGRYTLFLDSDDLVSPEKFRAQLTAMDASQADVTTTDIARVTLEGDYDSLHVEPDQSGTNTTDAAEFFLREQPPPHGPIFRTEFLRRVVAGAFFPPSPLYNNVAEIWFYHNAALWPARVARVPGAYTIVGRHPGARLTGHWERLAVASLGVTEAFARNCPATAATRHARTLVGENAFVAWRKLPRGFSPEFSARQLALWRKLPRGHIGRLGGGNFNILAGVLGPIFAARMLKIWQGQPYEACRTMTDADVAHLLAALPPT